MRAIRAPLRASLWRTLAVAAIAPVSALLAASPATAQGVPGPTQAPPASHAPYTPYGPASAYPTVPTYPTYPGPYPAPLPLTPGFYAGPMPQYATPGAPLILGVDDAPQRIDNYFAAGGPLERHTGRPGAWYVIVFVPAAHGPVQLWAWQRTRAHLLRVTAIDGWPAHAARHVVSLPLYATTTSSGRPLAYSVPFALPPHSRAEGVFLLVEQWSRVGDRPAAVWMQTRSAQPWTDVPVRGGTAWWQATEAAPPAPRDPLGRPLAPPTTNAMPPPSPLLAPRGAAAVIELPFMQLTTPAPRIAPTFDPWWER
jgi:hypothetical protein